MGSGRNSNSFKLSCMSLLPATARMKMIKSKMKGLEWSQNFPIISLWGFFPDAQGQLTPQSLVGIDCNWSTGLRDIHV